MAALGIAAAMGSMIGFATQAQAGPATFPGFGDLSFPDFAVPTCAHASEGSLAVLNCDNPSDNAAALAMAVKCSNGVTLNFGDVIAAHENRRFVQDCGPGASAVFWGGGVRLL